MTKTITIPEELRDKVQRADIETSARRDIIVRILGDPTMNVDEKRFAEYQQDYNDKFFAFEQAKGEVEREWVRKEVSNPQSWNLNYATCEVEVTY